MCDVAPARVLEIGRIGTRTDSPEAPDGRTSFGSAPTTVSGATYSLPLAPANVGLPNRQRPLRVGRRNRS